MEIESKIMNLEWLNSGGADIVLEVVRRLNWTVVVCSAEEWQFLPDIVSLGDRKRREIHISGAKPAWLQAVAAVATACTLFKRIDAPACEAEFHVFRDNDKSIKFVVDDINLFIHRVKLAGEVTIDLAGARSMSAGRRTEARA